MNGKGDTFLWPELMEYDPAQGPSQYARNISSLHHVSEASESREQLTGSPSLYRIKVSPSQAERKRSTEGDGWTGEVKIPKSGGVSVSDLVARLHNGPNQSQVLLAAKSSRQVSAL